MKNVLCVMITVILFYACEQKKIIIQSYEDGQEFVAIATSGIPAIGSTVTVMRTPGSFVAPNYIYNGRNWEGRGSDDFLGFVPVKREIVRGQVMAIR